MNSHRGKYSHIKKLKAQSTEMYILQVDKIFKCRNTITIFRVEDILSVENTILINSIKGKYSSVKKIEKHLHRGLYSLGR